MKKLFLNNLGLKITALVIAVATWYAISYGITAKAELQRKVINKVEVNLLRPNREEVIEPFKVKIEPRTVSLYVEGPKDQVQNLGPKNITAFVNISDFNKEGIYSLPVRVILPDNIKMLSESPICRVELSRYKKIEQ